MKAYITETPMNVLSLSALTAAGWTFTFTARGSGPFISFPGYRRHFPLRVDPAGNAHVEFVAYCGGYTPFDTKSPLHEPLLRNSYIARYLVAIYM